LSKPTVLLLHNRYREAGGEERSVAEIAALLRSRGHRVELCERASATLAGAGGRLRAGGAMLAGGLDPEQVEQAVRRSGAEIVHAHNLTPLLGARALAAARRGGARTVMHVHNYRLVCAIAVTYRDGGVCTRCSGRNTWPGVRLRCRGSLVEAAAYAVGLSLHQRRLLARVDRLVVPSVFAKQRLLELGLPAARSAAVLHNFLRDSDFTSPAVPRGGAYALFAGRLTEEKGADVAIEASARTDVPLRIAGAGPERERLERLADDLRAPVTFAGRLDSAELASTRRAAAFCVLPSRWDEPCPYAAIEAMAAGLPVLASAVGGLPELVGQAQTLPPGAIERWAAAMDGLWRDPEKRSRAGEDALVRARELFGEERFYSGLMDVYDSAGHRR
jgi:glycosyltransferase involved in cell wall biosynthesis